MRPEQAMAATWSRNREAKESPGFVANSGSDHPTHSWCDTSKVLCLFEITQVGGQVRAKSE